MQVEFTLIHPDAKMPERGHGIDVGLDVFTPEAGQLLPGPNKIPLGFSIDVPVGWCAAIYPRSGMASGEKTRTMVVKQYKLGMDYLVDMIHPNGVAILAQLPPIDPGYKGIVHAIIVNTSDLTIEYEKHTRFGQLVFVPCAYVQPVLRVDNTRGSDGFGSTGIKGGHTIHD